MSCEDATIQNAGTLCIVTPRVSRRRSLPEWAPNVSRVSGVVRCIALICSPYVFISRSELYFQKFLAALDGYFVDLRTPARTNDVEDDHHKTISRVWRNGYDVIKVDPRFVSFLGLVQNHLLEPVFHCLLLNRVNRCVSGQLISFRTHTVQAQPAKSE